MADTVLHFGDFALDLGRRVLLENGQPLRLGSRALDILMTLASRPGETVTKDELIAQVWPSTYVEEANLRVHVAALRKALGDGQSGNRYVANVTGRGYAFVGTIRQPVAAPPPAAPAAGPVKHPGLPSLRSRVIGRAETIAQLAGHFDAHGFLTIVGPGGIGKTTVAVAVADRLAGKYRDGVRFIDLAPIADPALVPGAVAASLDLPVTQQTATAALVAHLRERQMLLLLDNCEHVVEAAAFLAEALFRDAPGTHLLATSREALRTEGERVHRLAPLELPPVQMVRTVIEVMRFPAVQLFAERATASGDTFHLQDDDAPVVADLCRRLDGIPLAIEFAAARVDQFGIHGLAQRLDDRFQVLTKGRRTALPRHQTLRATLDWSYQTLSTEEQALLRRMAVFAGPFTMEAAHAIAADMETGQSSVFDTIAALAMKSLISVDVSGPETVYRLLETTRAYAQSRLKENGEAMQAMRRHADYCCRYFEHADQEWEKKNAADWLAHYGGMLDDVRAALDWAMGEGDDAGLALELAALCSPLWYQLSLLDEFRTRAERVLERIGGRSDLSPERQIQLLVALGHSYLNTNGLLPAMGTAFGHALALAQTYGRPVCEMRALWGLWAGDNMLGRYEVAAQRARRYCTMHKTAGDAVSRIIGDRMMMQSSHLLGDQVTARSYAEALLVDAGHNAITVRNFCFQIDRRTVATAVLCRILWLQGFPDQAMAMVDELVAHSERVQHAVSYCYALATSICLVAMLAGKADRAGQWIRDLQDRAAERALVYWHAWAQCYAAVLAGGPDASRLAELQRQPGFGPQQAEMLAIMRPQALTPAVFTRTDSGESWCRPELLRARGEQLLAGDASQAATAESLFDRALDLARSQQALSWELRAAISMARLRQRQGRSAEGRDLLAGIYGRFSEGHGTTDLRQARALLDDLSA